MLKNAGSRVNHAVRLRSRARHKHETRCVQCRRRCAKIRQRSAVQTRRREKLGQTCCDNGQPDATIHREFQTRKTSRRAAAPGGFPETRCSAAPAISSDAAPARQLPTKTYDPETAAKPHLRAPR